MTDKLYVKPGRPGLLVRKPDYRPLHAGGEWVASSVFWRRRLRAGDVVEAKPPKPEAKAKAKDDG